MPLEVDIVRDRNMLFRQTDEGLVENIYTLKINNMEESPHRYRIEVEGDYDYEFIGPREVDVAGGEIRRELVRLVLDPGLMRRPNTDLEFVVRAVDDPGLRAREDTSFIGPSIPR